MADAGRCARKQPLDELVERAGVERRDLQHSCIQAVALAGPIPTCELVGVVRDDNGEDALERRSWVA